MKSAYELTAPQLFGLSRVVRSKSLWSRWACHVSHARVLGTRRREGGNAAADANPRRLIIGTVGEGDGRSLSL